MTDAVAEHRQVEAKGVARVCAACGSGFEDLSRTSPRSYCYECRPVKIAGAVEAPRVVEVDPAAFTVEHFRAWSAKKRMKDGKRFELEDWQAAFLDDLFARDAEGLPVFAELWLIVPEGNGKTTFTSLLVLYVIEHTPEAWCPIAASARDQAVGLTYRIAAGFVERNRLTYTLHPGYREIRHAGSAGVAKIFASDAASGDGVDPVGISVIEELHRLPNLDLYETWVGKLDKSNAQLVVVSTAGEPGSPFELLRGKMRTQAVETETARDGCFVRAVGAGTVMHEYAVPAGGDPDDLELVAAANPFSGKTVESLRRKRAKASYNPVHWCRFTCNLAVQGESAAVRAEEWDALAGAELPPDGTPCWAGVDLAFKWDTTAIVPFWLRSTEDRVLGPAEILTPPRDGTSLDPSLVEQALERLNSRWPLHTVVVDRSKAEQMALWIEKRFECRVVERAQTPALLIQDYDRFLEAVRNGWLRHSGDAELRQHVLNAVAKTLPSGSSYFTRSTSMRQGGDQSLIVIDGLSAASMVHSVAVAEPAPRRSGYESRGLVTSA